MELWWWGADYLSVGPIHLLENPLLHEKLTHKHVKKRLLGHFGITPGLDFVWMHLNRLIRARPECNLYRGPGPRCARLARQHLAGRQLWRAHLEVPHDAVGMAHLFRRFSFLSGVPSYAAPETPDSIHEGGELGYSLSHAFGGACGCFA
jgi:xylulose-5-phosphate/fructose-6-phosphate phosphoketolase